jgi:hypothetical protein
MILFITSTLLLLWAAWLYWQHVVKPVNNEQTTNNYETTAAFAGLGNSEALFQTALIEECPECEGAKYLFYSCCTGDQVTNDYQLCPQCCEHLGEEDCNTCAGKGYIELY